jgi:threonine dehydrogenase-like Zn-dependent dehydrogenase
MSSTIGGLGAEETAVLPLLRMAVRAVRLARPASGESALVTGSGQLAKLALLALADARVRAVQAADGMAAAPAAAPDIAVDTTGDPAVIVALLERVARCGRVVLMGTTRGRTADVDFYRTVHQRGLEVIGVSDAHPGQCRPDGDPDQDTVAAERLLRERRDALPGDRLA